MFDFLSEKFSALFSNLRGTGKLTEHNISQICDTMSQSLLEADVPYELVQNFINSIKQEAIGTQVSAKLKPGAQFTSLVYRKMVEFMGGESDLEFSFQLPAIIMVCGLQGSGKTTTVAKLAHFIQKQAEKKNKKRTILCASVDFYRPAAVDQLSQLAKRAGIDFYRALATEPLIATREIYDQYKKGRYEILLLDTAGRLHIDTALLAELRSIESIIKPQYKFLVLDAMTGQESLTVATAFNQAVEVDGAILTKLDSDTRGGAAFAFRCAVRKPIRFIGTGEKLQDLALFHPKRAVGRIVGMGDLESLAEKAADAMTHEEINSKAIFSSRMTLIDFASQMAMIEKLGSLSQVSKYMPGLGSVSAKQLENSQTEMKQFVALINSMTLKERMHPHILNGSRKKRIAQGAGLPVTSVNLLLQRFEQVQQSAKLFKKLGFFNQL